jgi:hypothetical protein
VIDFNITYIVPALTRLDAITEATDRLRTGVKLRGVVSAEETPGSAGYWTVVLSVQEDV